MKELTVFLYRHGNTFDKGDKVVQVGLKSNLPLTIKGKQQAQVFADYLKQSNVPIQAIYCGDLKRQSESAQIIHQQFQNAALNLSESALDEIDYGRWEGLKAEDIESQWPVQANDWHNSAKWPQDIFNGSLYKHLDAIANFIHHLCQTHQSNDHIVLVSSNGIIRLFLKFTKLWDKICENGLMLDYKVGTGNFCKVILQSPNDIDIVQWNEKPSVTIPV